MAFAQKRLPSLRTRQPFGLESPLRLRLPKGLRRQAGGLVLGQ